MGSLAAERLAVNEPAVVSETIDGEVVVINLDKGAYYSLRNSAAFIWGLVQDGAANEEIGAALHRRYEGNAADLVSSAEQFLSQLLDEDLLRPVQDTAPSGRLVGSDATAALRTPFVAPALEKYTDMEHLLLLDPIHDVDDTGWPTPR